MLKKSTVGCSGTRSPNGATSTSRRTRRGCSDREVGRQAAAQRVAGERELVEAELVEQVEVVQEVVVRLSMLGSSADAPKPGMVRRRSAARRSASGSSVSKPVIVPAPWRKTSGSPSPAVRTAVSMPLMS